MKKNLILKKPSSSKIITLNRTLEFSNINGNILLKPDSNNLDEIVISASKFSQNLKEISQRVIFISTEDVVLSNPQTSADLLSSSGNVYIQKSQLGGGSPMIRGFSTNRLTLSSSSLCEFVLGVNLCCYM